MSTGEVKPQQSAMAKATTWTSRISSIIILAVVAAQQAGILTPQNAATIKQVNDQLVPIADRIETAIIDKKMPDASVIVDLVNQVKKLADQLQQEKKPKPEPTPIPVDPVPKPSPDQQRIKDMEEQIKKLLDELAKKHEPKPPEPVPPQTTDLKIVDAAGKPITGDIQSGQSVKVTASSAGDWKYLVTSGDGSGVSVFTYPDHCIVTLSGGTAVALSHSAATSHAMILVKCQDAAPRPPPRPIPDDESNHTKPRKLFIAVVEDVRNRSPQTATTLSDLETWNEFRDKGHEWRFYDSSTQETRGLRAVASAKTSTFDPPQIVIHDSAGVFVFSGQLPNMEGVNDLVARLEAGK